MTLRKPSVSAELVEARSARFLHARSQRHNCNILYLHKLTAAISFMPRLPFLQFDQSAVSFDSVAPASEHLPRSYDVKALSFQWNRLYHV